MKEENTERGREEEAGAEKGEQWEKKSKKMRRLKIKGTDEV